MTEQLECPICGAWFLRVCKASKTCSRECSHKLVKRRPRAAIYRKPKAVVNFLSDMLNEIRTAHD